MAIYYTTINGKLSGRASYGFKDKAKAATTAYDQNARARNMGIKAQYEVASCEDGDIASKEIRD